MIKNLTIALLLSYIACTTYFTTIGARFVIAEHTSSWPETKAAYERRNTVDVSKFMKVSLPALPMEK